MKSGFAYPHAASGRARRLALTTGLILTAALLAVALMPSVAAAVPEQGRFSVVLGTGSSGKALKKAGVKYSAVAPATGKRLSGKRVRIGFPLKSTAANAKVLNLKGGVRFSKGKRKLVMRKLSIVSKNTPTRVKATVGGKRITVFKYRGNIDETSEPLKIIYERAALSLGKSTPKLFESKLRVKRPPAARIGTLWGSTTAAYEDPYLEQCGLAATSYSEPGYPQAIEPPVLGGLNAVGKPITWGIRSGLNGYVNGFGSILGLDGAVVNRIPMAPPQVPPTGFTFVFAGGEYDANGPGTADDQAVLNGTGGVMYCNQPHGFRVNIANPTVVIDGESSRIIADVDTNISGDLAPARRVHLADLDLSAATVDVSVPGEVKWSFPATGGDTPTSSVTLSEDGSEALRLCEVSVPGAPPGCLYPPGTLLDALEVTAEFAVG